jgi:hypothetical protein
MLHVKIPSVMLRLLLPFCLGILQVSCTLMWELFSLLMASYSFCACWSGHTCYTANEMFYIHMAGWHALVELPSVDVLHNKKYHMFSQCFALLEYLVNQYAEKFQS